MNSNFGLRQVINTRKRSRADQPQRTPGVSAAGSGAQTGDSGGAGTAEGTGIAEGIGEEAAGRGEAPQRSIR